MTIPKYRGPDGIGHPLVSVIVTTYNRRALLEETLDSIRNQTYSNLEILVVDNESGDGTENYVRSLSDPRVRYFRNPNGGVIAVNRNFGLEQAEGDFVAFCDDDDLWLPRKIERQLEEFARRPDADVVATATILFDGRSVLGVNRRSLPLSTITFPHQIVFGNEIALSSVLARRSAILAVQGFDTNPEFCAVEDFHLWMKVTCAGGQIRMVRRPHVLYRTHPGQASAKDRRKTVLKIMKAVEDLTVRGMISTSMFSIYRTKMEAELISETVRRTLRWAFKKAGFLYQRTMAGR